MKNVTINIVTAGLLLNGCTTVHVDIPTISPTVQAPTSIEVAPKIAAQPPFWPPHEHEVFPGLIDVGKNIYLLESDHHWNHISFDSDPTQQRNIQ